MTPDPIDQFAARLFEAARSEATPAGAERRALEAMRHEISQQKPAHARFSARQKWLAAALAAAAVAASSALLLRPKPVSVGISAEPMTYAPELEHRALAPVEAPSAAMPPAPPASSAPASLNDELSALKVASSALSAGDPRAALAALDRYDHVLKGQKMRAEATLLRIEALERAGQAQTASALARRFVEQNPGSPLVDRARSFVHE